MRRNTIVSVVVAFLVVSFASGADPKASTKLTYDDHLLPLLREKCVSCHNPDKKKGDLQLHTYARLMAGSSGSAVVKPGDPDGSPLYLVTAHKDTPYMPPESPMLPK